jgi:tRNA pseudouridine55 synthase
VDGLLLVDKPAGITSFDVVRRVRGMVRSRTGQRKPKVGHTGTLDPFATGVLPIAIGQATKLARFLIDADKSYRATLSLGVATTTDDCDGDELASRPWGHVVPSDVEEALRAMVGESLQAPPIYSALRVDGKRAYAEARAGRAVVLKPRPIVVRALEVLEVDLPIVTFELTASKGTYIRAICRDVGETLGCGGHCSSLRRLSAAGFPESDAQTLELLSDSDWVPIPCMEMLRNLALVTVNEEEARIMSNGGWVYCREGEPGDIALPVRVSVDGLRLLCVARVEGGRIHPVRQVNA